LPAAASTQQPNVRLRTNKYHHDDREQKKRVAKQQLLLAQAANADAEALFHREFAACQALSAQATAAKEARKTLATDVQKLSEQTARVQKQLQVQLDMQDEVCKDVNGRVAMHVEKTQALQASMQALDKETLDIEGDFADMISSKPNLQRLLNERKTLASEQQRAEKLASLMVRSRAL
jgi:hypothetical protein